MLIKSACKRLITSDSGGLSDLVVVLSHSQGGASALTEDATRLFSSCFLAGR